MKKSILVVLAMFVVLLMAIPVGATSTQHGHKGRVVVANRASGSISVIDVHSDTLIDTYALPAGDNASEPMYVTYSKRGKHVFVGDRANNRVVAFDAKDFSVDAIIPAGNGVFHMWADGRDRQLWVNNDVDNTATVINPKTLIVITTVAMPADLVAEGYKPHDVILDSQGRFAYVTMVGNGVNDYLVQFSTKTFLEINRTAVGKDPHVSLSKRGNNIYVPAQNSDVVTVLNRNTLSFVTDIAVPGAHGAGMSPSGKYFYTTNLPGGGTDGLYTINTKTNVVVGAADTPYAVPHNVVVTKNNKLFVTHSGATSDKVTIYAVSNTSPVPTLIGEVTVELNPFGLAYIP